MSVKSQLTLITTPAVPGRVSPEGADLVAKALTWQAGTLAKRFTAYQRAIYPDGTTRDVAFVPDYVALCVTHLGVLKLDFGGRCPHPDDSVGRVFHWVGYGVSIDGRPVSDLAYSKPVQPSFNTSGLDKCDWTLWLPHNDFDALRAALRTGPAEVERRAKARFVFVNGNRYQAPVTVEFANPVAMFTTIEHTAMIVTASLPPEAERTAAANHLAVLGLILDGQPASLMPFAPPIPTFVGNVFANTIET